MRRANSHQIPDGTFFETKQTLESQVLGWPTVSGVLYYRELLWV
jgi:hypothetical protein